MRLTIFGALVVGALLVGCSGDPRAAQTQGQLSMARQAPAVRVVRDPHDAVLPLSASATGCPD